MSDLRTNIDARTRLAGADKLKIQLFLLVADSRTARRESFGLVAYKARQAMRTPPITAAPEMPALVEGTTSLSGTRVPVVNLAQCANMGIDKPFTAATRSEKLEKIFEKIKNQAVICVQPETES